MRGRGQTLTLRAKFSVDNRRFSTTAPRCQITTPGRVTRTPSTLVLRMNKTADLEMHVPEMMRQVQRLPRILLPGKRDSSLSKP
jgi:hypothetical protein